MIAENLKRIMNEQQLLANDLVRLTGISKGSISSYLSGRYKPNSVNLFKIAEALGVKMEELLMED